MAIFTSDARSAEPPFFRYTVMVRGDAQTSSFFEAQPWSAPSTQLPNN
jgi:hypothetical protein